MPARHHFPPPAATADRALFRVAILISLALHLLLLAALGGWLPAALLPTPTPPTTLQVKLLPAANGSLPPRAMLLAQRDSTGNSDAPPARMAQQQPATTGARFQAATAEQANRRPPAPPLAATAAIGVSWAEYVEGWRQRVERVGNLHYPGELRRRGLHGSLELLVTLRDSGELLDVRVTRSSGQTLLDQAALDIVRMAAPYPPFPPRLAAEYRSLQVVRKWTFTSSNQLAGS